MLALGKTRRGLLCRVVIFPRDDHYRLTNATWARDLRTFSGCLMEKDNEVRNTRTQIASVLTVATVFVGLLALIAILIFIAREGEGLIREIKIPT